VGPGNKRALVTGAAAGLGRALAVGLAKRGVAVAVADLNANGLEKTKKLLGAHQAESLSLRAGSLA
jgi:3-oxoacyl-[acyl-carrier protein] reductase